MLGKLLKYDLKALSRVLIPVHLAALAVAAVACAAAFTGYAVNELPAASASDYTEPVTALAALVLVMGVLALACVAAATFIVILWRFYKNLFTDEGYLTLTLPAQPSQQLGSKLIAGLIWMVVDAVVVFACLVVIIAAADGFTGALDLGSSVPYWVMRASTGYGMFGLYQDPTLLELLGACLQTLAQMAFGLLMAYAAFSLGAALAARHKVAAGIGLYVALSWGYGLLSGVVSVMGVFAWDTLGDVGSYYALASAVGTVLQLAACAVFWLICLWVLRRKVNLP